MKKSLLLSLALGISAQANAGFLDMFTKEAQEKSADISAVKINSSQALSIINPPQVSEAEPWPTEDFTFTDTRLYISFRNIRTLLSGKAEGSWHSGPGSLNGKNIYFIDGTVGRADLGPKSIYPDSNEGIPIAISISNDMMSGDCKDLVTAYQVQNMVTGTAGWNQGRQFVIELDKASGKIEGNINPSIINISNVLTENIRCRVIFQP